MESTIKVQWEKLMIDELKKAWDDKDTVKWIELKVTSGSYKAELGNSDPNFLKDMSLWNMVYSHEETQNKHYTNWHPHCCSDKPCKSRAFDRMEKRDYGWYCPFCKTGIGKHLYRIDISFYKEAIEHELVWSTVYGGLLLGNLLTKPTGAAV